MHKLLIIILLTFATSLKAEHFIGQWYLTVDAHKQVAATRDGDSQLHLEVVGGKVVAVRLVLAKFSSFGEQQSVLQYSSPVYGLIRTTKFNVENGEVLLTDPFEIHSFVENLKHIATHFMWTEDNFGNSFKDRKLTIAYIAQGRLATWQQSRFSTVEIDEVLEKLGVVV